MMRFLTTAIVCRLKLAVTPALVAAMLLLSVFLAFVTLAFGERQVLVMNVGLFYSDTPYAQGLAADYTRYAAENVHVTRYDTLDAMCSDIKTGRLECAYALPQAYEKDGQITLYVTPDTMGATVSNVLLASAYMQEFAADLGYKVIKNHLPDSKGEVTAALAAKNQSYLSRGAFIEVQYEARKAGRESASAHAGDSLYYALNGVTALFSLLITMLFCLELVRERKTAIAIRLSLAGDSAVYGLANIIAILLINLGFFAAAGIMTGAPPPLSAALAYAFFVSVFGVCLGSAIKSESVFLGTVVLLFLCTAVLGGVFVDIGGLIPSLDKLKFLFATHYFMESLRGSASHWALAAAAVLLTGALCAVRMRNCR